MELLKGWLFTSKGFTLIEILITITVISLLFGAAITASNAVQRNSRDFKRQSDLRLIQSSLQQFYADQNFYPDDNLSGNSYNITSSTPVNLTNQIGNPATPAPTPLKTYINTPKDPDSSKSYCYRSFTNIYALPVPSPAPDCNNAGTDPNQRCHSYLLCAKLENSAAATSTNCNTHCSSSGYNFEIAPNN